MMLVQTEVSEEDELILSATNGDRGAFGELYVRYARMVHGILLARVPAGDAEDLVQRRSGSTVSTAVRTRSWFST